jgi:hypothetical protein
LGQRNTCQTASAERHTLPAFWGMWWSLRVFVPADCPIGTGGYDP